MYEGAGTASQAVDQQTECQGSAHSPTIDCPTHNWARKCECETVHREDHPSLGIGEAKAIADQGKDRRENRPAITVRVEANSKINSGPRL